MSLPPPLPASPEQVALLVHDLRNPLAGVTAALQLLGMGLEPAEQEEIRAEATWAATRLARMISDLLLLQAVADGGPTLQAAPVPLGPLVEAAERQAALCARLEGVRLSVEAGVPVHTVGDAALVSSLLDHLLVAAVRHAPPGGEVAVRLAQEPSGPSLAVTIPPGDGATAWRETLDAPPLRWPDRGWRGDLSSSVALVRLLAGRLGGGVEGNGDPDGGLVVLLRFPTLPAHALPG